MRQYKLVPSAETVAISAADSGTKHEMDREKQHLKKILADETLTELERMVLFSDSLTKYLTLWTKFLASSTTATTTTTTATDQIKAGEKTVSQNPVFPTLASNNNNLAVETQPPLAAAAAALPETVQPAETATAAVAANGKVKQKTVKRLQAANRHNPYQTRLQKQQQLAVDDKTFKNVVGSQKKKRKKQTGGIVTTGIVRKWLHY
jgi:hypothetical protein